MHQAQKFIQDTFEIIHLKNEHYEAKIAVNIGNTLFSFYNKHKEYIYFPFSLATYKNNKKLEGNPFMHPWANRLEGEYIHVEKTHYAFPHEHKYLLYRDANHLPLHGLLLKSDKWKTSEIIETASYCSHTAKLEFNEVQWLSIFPFLHDIKITHRLRENHLTIETCIHNKDKKPMPISFGFHPYFTKPTPAYLSIPATEAMALNELLLPTSNKIKTNDKWQINEGQISLDNQAFDDGFYPLQFTHQHAKFSLNNLDILFDEHYAFAQVYAPLNTDKPYVCIEPMTASTNALNTNSCPTILPNQSFNAIFSIQINE